MATSNYPSNAFETSLAAARQLLRSEQASPRINPACHSILLEHGHRTPRAIAFMHGITSSPFQFRQLGALFQAHGYNVFIPRMPRHGYRDRLTTDPANLTVGEYTAYASQTVEIARGLGEHLTVAGLSVSGVLAGWCAQTQAMVDLAVLIAPSFAPRGVPLRMMPVLAGLVKRLPNFMVWWDIRRRARIGPVCSYPRFSTHALAASFELGLDVYAQARTHAPACQQILAVTNSLDPAVGNTATRAVLNRWRNRPGVTVRDYTFDAALGPLHDIIGPYQPEARIESVYPTLLELIGS